MNENPGGGGILLAHVQTAAARRGREWARRTFRAQLADGVLRVGMMFQAAPSVAMIRANNAGASGDQVVADLQALATIAGAATEWSRLHTDWLRDQRATLAQRASAERWEVARMVSTRATEKIHLGVVVALSLPGAWAAARARWPVWGKSCPGYVLGQLVVVPEAVLIRRAMKDRREAPAFHRVMGEAADKASALGHQLGPGQWDAQVPAGKFSSCTRCGMFVSVSADAVPTGAALVDACEGKADGA